MAFMATRDESKGEESRPVGYEPDHVGPFGSVRTVALLCQMKEMPKRPWVGCPWDLVPVLIVMWKWRPLARC